MDYHVARNNDKLGVFAGAEAQARFQRGEILPTDLVWCEGMPAWRPASEVFMGAAPSEPPPVIPPPPTAPFAAGPFAATPSQPKPDNYLVWAILTTLLCCIPFGIVAIVFATQVDSKYATGDYAGAQAAAAQAKFWCWLGVGGWLLIVGISLALFLFPLLFGAIGAFGAMAQ